MFVFFIVATLGISCSMGEKDKKEERMSVRVFCAEKAVSEGEREIHFLVATF